MIFAFGRLFFILIATVLCIFLGVFTIKNIGSHISYTEIRHPILQLRLQVIGQGGDLDYGPEQSPSAIQAAVSNHVGIALKARLTKDGAWLLYGPKNLQTDTTGHGFVGEYTADELKKFRFYKNNEPLLFLNDILSQYTNTFFMLEILQPGGVGIQELLNIIKEQNAEERIIVHSPFLDTTRELRAKSYKWLTGAATAEVSKAQFMSSIYLESAFNLDADLVIVPKYSPLLLTELFKRKKLVALPTNDTEQFSALLKDYPQLIALTTRPGYFAKQLLEH